MGIVATEEPDEATFKLASEIKELLDRDVWEKERTLLICKKHREISSEAYLQVWEHLDSRIRSAWKAYVYLGEHGWTP